MTIHEVNIKHITDRNKLEMQILRDFFEIDSQNAYDKFSANYGNHEYGRLLLSSYSAAVGDVSFLDNLREEEKFMFKLSEEERLEERQKEKLAIAKNLLKKGFSIEDIIDATGLTKQELLDITK